MIARVPFLMHCWAIGLITWAAVTHSPIWLTFWIAAYVWELLTYE